MAETVTTEIGEKSRNGTDLPNNNAAVTGTVTAAAILPQQPAADDADTSKTECVAAVSGTAVKRRKTRRGKTKRRNTNSHPYMKQQQQKPEAPYNSNRFLIEDHGDDLLDDDFDQAPDQASTSTVTRTRDSSFSMEDSDGPNDTPYCDPSFPSLIREFDNQYESLQVERLQSMSKDELIQEFMRYEHMMERKVEVLVEQMKKPKDAHKCQNDECRKEAQRLTLENDILRQENESMKATMNLSSDSGDDSADSESDSDDSSDSVSSGSSSLSRPPTPTPNHVPTAPPPTDDPKVTSNE